MPAGTVNERETCFHTPPDDGTSASHAYETEPPEFVYSASISVTAVELYQALNVYLVPAVTLTGAAICQRASPEEFVLKVTDAPLVPPFPTAG